jgi:SAM-dependent methyltransferase
MKRLIERLRAPEVVGVGVDGDARLIAHGAVLSEKPLLRELFAEIHRQMRAQAERYLTADGQEIELGAGVAPMRDSFPDVLSTDVLPAPHLDRVLDAQAMELEDASVRVFYLQNVLHHFPQPERFFDELLRVLRQGGGAVILEPYYGPFAAFLFRRLFVTEGFDKSASGWDSVTGGPMSGANQALSHNIFVRDRGRFESRYPQLRIVHREPLSSWPRYLLSGGLNFRQLCPNALVPLVKAGEFVLAPLKGALALHYVIVLRKEEQPR